MRPARGRAIDSQQRPSISDRRGALGVCGVAKTNQPLKAPFPYFGGKRRVAELVWSRLGDCDNFIEPFCGSAAVLLARPHAPRVETVNDADCMVANFWRATQQDPEAVAAYADGPVNEADLHARHRWLVLSDAAAEFRRRMRTDPHYFDARVAGWWCWGLCCWIGGGWCTAHGETADGGRKQERPCLNPPGKGVNAGQVPNLSGDAGAAGRGVVASAGHKKRPRAHSGNGGNGGSSMPGVHGQVPAEKDLASKLRIDGDNPGSYGTGVHARGPREKQPTAEQCRTGGKGVRGAGGAPSAGIAVDPVGVNRKGGRPQLADAYDVGRGVNSHGELGTCEARRAWLVDWFGRLRDRLRLVRVCCGDWLRVCNSESVTTRLGTTGIFFDPPYSAEAGRDMNLYAVECGKVAHAVRAYCLERGPDPRVRIALAGYEGEGHEALEAAGWSVVAWKAHGGYGNRSAKGKANAERERIWFSPHCAGPDDRPGLFDDVPDDPRP